MPPARRRTGRRLGDSGARQQILDTASREFAQHGFDGATIRAIAAQAEVDPALVHHYFGTKEKLFADAVRFPVDPAVALPALLAPGVDGLGERIVRFFVTLWDQAGDQSPFFGVIRGAVSHEQSADLLREFMIREVLGRVAAAVETPDGTDPMLRATLVGSQLVGLGMVRYLLRVEPLASAGIDEVVAAVAPTVQRYLTGDLST